jgi:hypothetical protein
LPLAAALEAFPQRKALFVVALIPEKQFPNDAHSPD